MKAITTDVSIIVPVYNVAPYIEDCLQSVMRQTYKGSMECLIVDDCGTDDSIVISERMIAEYDGPIHFQILHHEYNRGLSAARNTGLFQAIGDYIYYLDGDDEITDNCIEKLMEVTSQDSSVEIVQGNNRVSRKRHDGHANTNEEVRENFFHEHNFSVYAWNKLIKRSFLLQNQLLFKEGLLWEDSYWIFFVLKNVKKVRFVPDVTYHYRVRPSSIVTGTDKRTKAKHRAVFYHDVLMNLTSRDELTEMKYIISQFIGFYSRFVRELPEYKDVYSMFWEKAREHQAYGLNLRLAFCYSLGKTKLGWIVWPLINRLNHPSIFFLDYKRMKLKLFPPSSYPALN